MLDVFKKFAVDVTAETEGTWVDFYDAKVKIARMGNKHFSKELAKAFDENRAVLDKGDEQADQLAETLLLGVFADTLIKDWKGIGYKGKEVKYSREAVIDLLGKPEMRELREEILKLAEDAEHFRLKVEAAQEKNSLKS